MFASPADLRDYRTFRMAAHEGRRLYEAERYLERHPKGAFADEVRAVFDAEEPAWFEAAKTSRVRAREYVVDLPDGPHVDAARTLMVLFDERQDDVETVTLLADVRRTAAKLDYESNRRHRVSDVILAELGALAGTDTWGARLDAPPPALAAVLRGETAHTWGAGSHAQRHDSLIFVIPTPTGSEPSVADVTFQLWVEGGGIAEGLVQGDDLFVRWAESLQVRTLDAGKPEERRFAAAAVVEVLQGAFEATLPAARCTRAAKGAEILSRSCDGWDVSVRMGEGPGTLDVIDVRGPRPPSAPAASSSAPERARAPGMR
jgi:hypothetical protein